MSEWLPAGYSGHPMNYVSPLHGDPALSWEDAEEDDLPEWAECCREPCDACREPGCVDTDDPAVRCGHGYFLHRECRTYCRRCHDNS